MALTAADAYRRAVDRFLGKLSGSENVGQMEKKIADHLRLAKLRPKVDVELSFNEAAGVLAISTAQLQRLLKEHPPHGDAVHGEGNSQALDHPCSVDGLGSRAQG